MLWAIPWPARRRRGVPVVDRHVIPYLGRHTIPYWPVTLVLSDPGWGCQGWGVDDVANLAGKVVGRGLAEANSEDGLVGAAPQPDQPDLAGGAALAAGAAVIDCLGSTADAAALQRWAVGLDGAEGGQADAGRGAQQPLGEADAVQDDGDDVDVDRLRVVAAELGDVGAEHQPDACPLQRAGAEAERLERGQLPGVQPEAGFPGDGVRRFRDAVEPEPAVHAALLRIGGPPGRGQRLVQLVQGAAGGVGLVAPPGLHLDRGDVHAAFAGVQGDREQVGALAGEPVPVLV